ncbi:MAG TPA: MFS transporter [Pseudonocardiaceae bacterium]|nr:MFS transporter [Pseudonocardiaceae bacterium]
MPETTKTLPVKGTKFGLFWMGQTVSQFGDRISALALPLIAVVMLHAQAEQTALLTALIWLPNLLSPVVGTWVDGQTHKRRLMILADVLRALALLSLPVTYLTSHLAMGQLYVVGLLAGIGQMAFDVSYPSFFVTLIPRSSYVDANSKLSTTRSMSFVAGPAIGGALIQAVSAPVAVALDAFSFLFSATVIGRIKADTPPAADRKLPFRQRVVAGMAFIRRHSILRASLACSTTMNFFMFAAQALIILFANTVLRLSAGEIGFALGIGAVGGLIGAVVARRVVNVVGLGRTIMLGAALYPSPLALLAVAHGSQWTNALALGGMEFLSGFGVMLFDIGNNSLRAAVTPDAMRSRTSGAYSAVNYGSRPLGALVGGWLGTAIGLRPTLLTAAILGAAGCLWLLLSPIPGLATVPESVNEPTAT